MKNAKPIFIVGVPSESNERIVSIAEQLTEKFQDYYVIWLFELYKRTNVSNVLREGFQ